MKARTHDLAAITALGIMITIQPPRTITLGTALIAFLANQLGGIAPDIDQPTAPFWRNLPIGGFVGKVIGKMVGGHRFITHSLLGLGIFAVLVRLLLTFLHPIMPNIDSDLVWMAFMIGMVSHLVMDTFTKEGVPWLLPIPIKIGLPPVKSLRVTTGTWTEGVVFVGLLAFDVYLVSANHETITALFHRLSG